MTRDRLVRFVLLAAALFSLLAFTAACSLIPADPPVLDASRWRLTVSPQEPAAGIKSEVTVMRLGEDGKPLPFVLVMPVPQVRARDLDTKRPIVALPRNIDHRGAWLYDLAFPTPGRWQVAFAAPPATLEGRWPQLPVVAPAILRDAVGDDDLSLVVRVAPDRGPVLWWLRTHPLEVAGFLIILLASITSYVAQQRRVRASALAGRR